MKAKYKNLRLCQSTNTECQKLIQAHIRSTNGFQHHSWSKIKNLSIPVESVIRKLYGCNAKERYLLYDVIYQKIYHTEVREMDFVNIKSSNYITIGEIKLTSNKRLARQTGVAQLKKSSEILKTKYSKVECVLIIIDFLDKSTNNVTYESLFSNSKSITQENGFEYTLITIPAVPLLNYLSENNILFPQFVKLINSAIKEAQNNSYLRNQSRIDKKSKKIEQMVSESKQEKINNDTAIKQTEPVLFNLINSALNNNRMYLNMNK